MQMDLFTFIFNIIRFIRFNIIKLFIESYLMPRSMLFKWKAWEFAPVFNCLPVEGIKTVCHFVHFTDQK